MKKRSSKPIKEEDENTEQPKEAQSQQAAQTPEQQQLSQQIVMIEKQISDLERDTATKKANLEAQLSQVKEKYRAAGGDVQ